MKIGAIRTGLLEQRNETFREYLQSGVKVRFFDGTVQAVHRRGGSNSTSTGSLCDVAGC